MNHLQNGPVRLRDLEVFRQHLGLSVVDYCWCLGIAEREWGTLQRDSRLTPECPVKPVVALLIRWLIDHPRVTPSLYATPADLFLPRLRAAVGPITGRWFSLVLGWDSSAHHRWRTLRSPINPSGRRALALLDSTEDRRLTANWSQWSSLAVLEASLRGIDLPNSRGWNLRLAT